MRPQTYEDAAEAKVLSYVFAGRSGLENTSFALLDPEGKKLTRGSRSPSMTYGSAARFEEALKQVSAPYAAKARPIAGLPALKDLRIALNVAAADMRPLVVLRADDDDQRQRLRDAASTLAWDEDRVGRFHFVVLEGEATFEGLSPGAGMSVIQPDPYGLGGAVIAEAKAGATAKELAKALDRGLRAFEAKAREHDEHVREARRRGIRWETALPVTDSHDRRGRRPDRRGPRPGRSDR